MQLREGHYSSPRWSWEILDCAMPMTFDTYSNCAFQCVYCFSFFQRALGDSAEDYLHHRVNSVDVEKVKRMFLEPDEHAGSFAWYIKNRMVLQWGGLSDGFDWYERKLGKSLELLRFFRDIDYPISISTKATWYLDDPRYVECFRDARNIQMKLSIITANPAHAKALEAGTPNPQERFEALGKLKALGVGYATWRFRPFIIGTSDLSAEEGYRLAKANGVDTLTTEFLCLERRSTHNLRARARVISEVVGYDVWQFYVQHSPRKTGLMRLNYDLKRPYIDHLLRLSDEYSIPLFISDAHHKEKSAGTGCCGLPDSGPLGNINRGQFAEAIQIARKVGVVRWSDISHLAEGLKNVRYIKATGYNVGNTRNKATGMFNTMFDFMRNEWNDSQSVNSPARYFGGALVPGGTDEHGDLIYLYNRPFVDDGRRVKSVNELLVSLKESIREDGKAAGHVGFPIYVDVRGGRFGALSILSDARLNTWAIANETPEEVEALLKAHPTQSYIAIEQGEDFAAHLAEEGYEYLWLIDGDFSHEGNLRALLSEAEAEMKEQPAPGVRLVRCAA